MGPTPCEPRVYILGPAFLRSFLRLVEEEWGALLFFLQARQHWSEARQRARASLSLAWLGLAGGPSVLGGGLDSLDSLLNLLLVISLDSLISLDFVF